MYTVIREPDPTQTYCILWPILLFQHCYWMRAINKLFYVNDYRDVMRKKDQLLSARNSQFPNDVWSLKHLSSQSRTNVFVINHHKPWALSSDILKNIIWLTKGYRKSLITTRNGLVVSTVSADGLPPLGARTSAKYIVHIYGCNISTQVKVAFYFMCNP